MRRVIVCLDVRGERVVKGVRFGNLQDCGDPAQLAAAYEQQGADEITLLDISATLEERATTIRTVMRVREKLGIPLTVGGGVRTLDDCSRLLDAGADKVALNSAAVAEPSLLARAGERFGRQCIVLAIDAQRTQPGAWRVVVRSGTRAEQLCPIRWAQQATNLGAGEVLLTSWDQDGTGEGYDLPLIREVSRAVGTPVIASGGARTAAHMLAALQAGSDAVLAAGIFHRGEVGVRDVKASLRAQRVEVRS
jgi:imidazoleglycerol phosphate synthase cyclase subunit